MSGAGGQAWLIGGPFGKLDFRKRREGKKQTLVGTEWPPSSEHPYPQAPLGCGQPSRRWAGPVGVPGWSGGVGTSPREESPSVTLGEGPLLFSGGARVCVWGEVVSHCTGLAHSTDTLQCLPSCSRPSVGLLWCSCWASAVLGSPRRSKNEIDMSQRKRRKSQKCLITWKRPRKTE